MENLLFGQEDSLGQECRDEMRAFMVRQISDDVEQAKQGQSTVRLVSH